MTASLADLQQALHDRINNLRSLNRLINSDDFYRLFKSATNVDKDTICSLILSGDKNAIEQWVRKETIKNLAIEELSMRDLRKLAAQHCIANYATMSKSILLSAIVKRISDAAVDSTNRKSVQGNEVSDSPGWSS